MSDTLRPTGLAELRDALVDSKGRRLTVAGRGSAAVRLTRTTTAI